MFRKRVFRGYGDMIEPLGGGGGKELDSLDWEDWGPLS